MKKVYRKPEIIFNDFSLSTSIAGDCDKDVSTALKDVCGIEFGDSFIFLDDVQLCSEEVEDGDPVYGSLCYHNPTDTTNLFNS